MTPRCLAMNAVRAGVFVALTATVAWPAHAWAQAANGDAAGGPSTGGFGGGQGSDVSGSDVGGGAGRHHRGGHHQQDSGTAPATRISLPKLVPDPRQRLDVGALLCDTEAELRQHQTAIMARIAGKYAPEPSGCRVVGEMVAVSVLGQDGPARTQVQLRGKQVQSGWTDAVVRDAQVSGP
jgi:hypothetical protein